MNLLTAYLTMVCSLLSFAMIVTRSGVRTRGMIMFARGMMRRIILAAVVIFHLLFAAWWMVWNGIL